MSVAPAMLRRAGTGANHPKEETVHRARITFAATILAAALFAARHPRESAASEPAPLKDAPLVVTSAWLAEHLEDRNLVLLHVGDPNEYPAAHIPGARFVSQRDVSTSSPDHDKGLMLEVPAADSLRAQLQRLGISNDSRIVVYYGNDWVSPATRIVFTLDYAGLGAQTSLLDGGMQDWLATGHQVTKDVPAPRSGTLAALRVKPIVVDAAWVNTHLHSPKIAIVDGRAASFYDGIEATGDRKGHVPGAHSVPFTEITDDKLHVKSNAALAELFTKAGVQPGDTVVGYCHIGQQATAMLFAARTLGHPVKLYDGSMQDWSRRTDLPVELR
jgi:thiosulfate/3-mercaptopyruvate sulfurtransferase